MSINLPCQDHTALPEEKKTPQTVILKSTDETAHIYVDLFELWHIMEHVIP